MTEDKEGKYCTVCGGVVPASIQIRKIAIEGKEIGLDQLDLVLDQVAALRLKDEVQIREELVKRVSVFNYVPTKKRDAYAAALMEEYWGRLQRPKGSG
ncbi:MAG: NAC family transcription factor [Methanomicrobiales archaeon]|nr:NAC family transcription factor [Methanomicrobiales archaeon]